MQAPIFAAAGTGRVPRFLPPEILWYFGALVAAGAGDILIADTSSAHRGIWMLLVGLACMAVFGALAAAFLRLGHWLPGGVVAAAVVWLAPPTEVAFEHLCGVHPRLFGGGPSQPIDVTGVGAVTPPAPGGGFHGSLFSIAVGTAIVGLAVFWLVRFAFVLLPVVVSLAIAVLLFLPAVVSHPSGGDYIVAALLTGIVFCVGALLLDAREHRADAFWWYVVGLFEIAVAFVYYLARSGGWVWLVLLVVAAAVLVASAPLARAVWAVYALVGVYAALVHYVADATGSWRTALVLTIVGLLLVAAGLALDLFDGDVIRRITQPRPPRVPQPPP